MDKFAENNAAILKLLGEWEPKLMGLSGDITDKRLKGGGWSIKEIVGHMIDSASNNLHRIIHLQYGKNPLAFPDYAGLGNNDKWVSIQNYQHEDWHSMVKLWKYSNLHLMHVINNVDPDKLGNEWINAEGDRVSLEDMINDYLSHFKMHLEEIAGRIR